MADPLTNELKALLAIVPVLLLRSRIPPDPRLPVIVFPMMEICVLPLKNDMPEALAIVLLLMVISLFVSWKTNEVAPLVSLILLLVILMPELLSKKLAADCVCENVFPSIVISLPPFPKRTPTLLPVKELFMTDTWAAFDAKLTAN